MLILRDVHIIDGFIKDESCRLLDFTDIPVTVRHILKGEAAVIAGYGGHQGVFFGKFYIITLKQTDERTAERLAVLVHLFAGNRAVNQLVFHRLAIIYSDFYRCGFLSRILKNDGVLRIRKDIMLVCRKLLHIKAAQRQIRLNSRLTVFIKGDDFN